MFVVTDNLRAAVLEYLSTRPWREVNEMMQILAAAKTVDQTFEASGKVVISKADAKLLEAAKAMNTEPPEGPPEDSPGQNGAGEQQPEAS